MWAAAMRQFNSFSFFSYCPNSQQQLLESFLYCKINYSDHSEKSIVNLYYSWKQWDRQCSMWVMAAGSLSSFSVRRAVKGYDWHEVLSLVPRHTSYPLLPGPFVLLNTHTHTETPSAVVIHKLHAGAAHSLLSYFAFSYSSLFHSVAVFYLEGKSQAIQNFCL